MVFLLLSCTTPCPFGPSCEQDFPTGRLAAHIEPVPDADAWNDATLQLQGEDNEGSTWSLDTTNGIVVGQPSMNQVVRYAVADGNFATTAVWRAEEGAFGTSIATGDLDGNGLWDLVVGAPQAELKVGRVDIFFDAQAAEGEVTTADVTLYGEGSPELFGERLALCGDLTGDGGAELVIGAPWFGLTQEGTLGTNQTPLLGAVYLAFNRDIVGEAPRATLGWYGDGVGDAFGRSMLCTEDFTGDGAPDLVVGAPFAGSEDEGKVYVLRSRPLPDVGGPIGATAAEDGNGFRKIELSGRFANAWAGMAIAALDVDSDDTTDLAVGSPGANDGRGETLLFAAREMTDSPQDPKYYGYLSAPDLVGTIRDGHAGRTLATGDLDGDGLTDLVVGAPDYRTGAARSGYDNGRIWIYFGANAATWQVGQTPVDGSNYDARILSSEQPFQRAGQRIAITDLDDDGKDDVLLQLRAPLSSSTLGSP